MNQKLEMTIQMFEYLIKQDEVLLEKEKDSMKRYIESNNFQALNRSSFEAQLIQERIKENENKIQMLKDLLGSDINE